MDLVLTGTPKACRAIVAVLQERGDRSLSVEASHSGKSLRCLAIAPDPAMQALVATACESERVDHAWIRAREALSEKGLLVMDMDSTLITIECIDAMAELHGVGPEVARITQAAMRGEEVDFRTSLTRRLALLAGAPESILERVYTERLHLSPGAERLLEAVRASGLRTLLVSGGFSFFAERLRGRLQLDYVFANTLEIQDGRLTGRLVGPVIDAQAKRDTVLATCAALAMEPSRAIVVGDGANDLAMMAAAGMSIAYHAKPVVIEAAQYAVRFGGLDLILEWFSDWI